MLLSRALNRGYASGRARWPVEFGLLNQDALWVMVVPTLEPRTESQPLNEADDRQDGENLSFNEWKTIAFHGYSRTIQFF